MSIFFSGLHTFLWSFSMNEHVDIFSVILFLWVTHLNKTFCRDKWLVGKHRVDCVT
jgi:hypothetical protein